MSKNEMSSGLVGIETVGSGSAREGGGYQVILCDPPWRYDFSPSRSRRIENQYPTMPTEAICRMEVPSAKDAVLFLWATAPKLEDALLVMKRWGFRYKSHFVWDNVKLGMGYWARGQHELLLVGVKGKFSPPAPSLRIGSVYKSSRGRHSEKPEGIRSLIASWYPAERKLELFARCKTADWDAFGNEIVSDVEIATPQG